MQEMLVKKFRLTLEFFGLFGKPKTIHFDFEQGKLKDLLLMKNELNDAGKLDKWLMDFLMKKTIQSDKLTMRLYRQLGTDQKVKIIQFLLHTYGKGYFSKTIDQSEEKKARKKKMPTSSMICLILDKTSETMESVLEMTWEQIEYLIEGIVWNLNAGSGDKGEKKNEQYLRMKEVKSGMTESEAEQLARLREKIKQKNLKKQSLWHQTSAKN